MGFNFRDREVAEGLKRLLSNKPYSPVPNQGSEKRQLRLTEGWILETPSGGIAARSGTTISSAACTVKWVNDSGTLENYTNNAGNAVTLTVYNVFTADIAGSTIITAKTVFGKLIADAEDCG
jgi:hypothetical protein